MKTAADLMARHNKKTLIAMARAIGWRGDHARAPAMQLAIYIASNGATERKQSGGSHDRRGDSHDASQEQGAQSQGEQGESHQDAQSQGSRSQHGEQSQQGEQSGSQGEQSGDQSQQGEQSAKSEQDARGEQGKAQPGEQSKGEQSKGEQSKGEQSKGEQSKGEQSDAQGPRGDKNEQPQAQQGDGQDSDEQDAQREDSEQSPPDDKAWRRMLRDAGITTPHPMLRKLHALAVLAKLNVMLVGPAGCGKTMLGEQLAKLIAYHFAFISCTTGMSESQLTGWLLPVGDDGKFEYVAAPFVTAYTKGRTVFLMDELDRSDANTILVLNAALANGHLAVPHNLKNPKVARSDTAVIVGAANTYGGGADELYTSASALDASTLDRFYMVTVDYDAAYEASLFGAESAQRRGWKPQGAPTAETVAAAFDWFKALRLKCQQHNIPRVVSTRMGQKLVAALRVGVSLADAKRDLLAAWSADEKRRVGESV